MEHLLTLENGAALLTLTIMEIVLGIDNLVFIAILAAKLPASKQDKARKIGLLLAMVMRIALLFCISLLMGLTADLFSLFGNGISGRDMVLILGGGFLVWKAVHEIHDKLEGSQQTLHQPRASAGFASVITQILMMDLIFSLDSVITAVGMVRQDPAEAVPGEAAPLWVPMTVMVTAIVISIAVMIAFAGPISRFIEKHPTTKMLALSFLLLIGVMLAAEGLDAHISRGYIYSAMGFSIFVEMLNQQVAARRKQAAAAGTG